MWLETFSHIVESAQAGASVAAAAETQMAGEPLLMMNEVILVESRGYCLSQLVDGVSGEFVVEEGVVSCAKEESWWWCEALQKWLG